MSAPTKRPVAFRIPRVDGGGLSTTEWRYFTDEAQAYAEAEALGIDYQGLYARDGSAHAGAMFAQLFVVDNPKNGAVYVFDNHDAALKCRTELRLNWEHLRGCVIFSDWQDGQPVRLS